MHDISRSYITITGDDAESFLQGLVSQDVLGMRAGDMRFGALLSPQGKWQHDFFILRTEDGFALDTLEATRAALQQKLMIYKLRAKVSIAHQPEMQLYYLPAGGAGLPDPRDARLPNRLWQASDAAPASALSRADYDSIRMQHFIPEGGIEVTTDETAMDVSYDMLHGISFTKGCYVGQEVTARMHYKNIARKGIIGVKLDAPANITCPAPITHDGKEVAELRSVHGDYGIAYGKFELVAPLLDSSTKATVENTQIALVQPDWQVDKYTRFAHEKNL